MSSAPYTLEDLEAELDEGWEILWEGRTGSPYPPNYRMVELEMDVEGEPYTRHRQLHLLEKEFEEVEKLRDDEDDEGEGAEGDEAEGEGEDSEALPDPIDDLPGSVEEVAKLTDDELRALADHVDAEAGSDPDRAELVDELIGTLELEGE